MGQLYLEVGPLKWRDRADDWAGQRWFLHFCLMFAPRGR
jgi:hypothetical protein